MTGMQPRRPRCEKHDGRDRERGSFAHPGRNPPAATATPRTTGNSPGKGESAALPCHVLAPTPVRPPRADFWREQPGALLTRQRRIQIPAVARISCTIELTQPKQPRHQESHVNRPLLRGRRADNIGTFTAGADPGQNARSNAMTIKGTLAVGFFKMMPLRGALCRRCLRIMAMWPARAARPARKVPAGAQRGTAGCTAERVSPK